MRASREQNEVAGQTEAASLRASHKLGIAPIPDVASFAEEIMGFDVLLMDMNTVDEKDASYKRVDAMVARDPQRDRTLIAVATTRHAERQRFSLAHELGHAILGDLVEGDEFHAPESDEEDRAQCFARHLLIPVDGMNFRLAEMRAMSGQLGEHHLSALVQHFGVSPVVAARQLHREGWIDDAQLTDWTQLDALHLAAMHGWEAERKARVVTAMTPRVPQRLAANAARAFSLGLIPLETLAAVRGETQEETRAWVRDTGIVVMQGTQRPESAPQSAEL